MNKLQLLRIASRSLTLRALASMAVPALAQREVILPAEGSVLPRTHVAFRWKHDLQATSDYFLEVVIDNAQPDPFLNNPTVAFVAVANSEPRAEVTSGLTWGTDYAWRVQYLRGPAPLTRVVLRTQRFSTRVLPANVPTPVITRPLGPGLSQPGITTFGLNFSALLDSFPAAGDEDGNWIYYWDPGSRTIVDWRIEESDGHTVFNFGPFVQNGPGGRGVEGTIDGKVLWITGRDDEHFSVHHEVLRMPNGNILALSHEWRFFPAVVPMAWQGDYVAEVDRHTRQIVKSWSTFDDYSILDFQPQTGPGNNWTHGNAAAFDPATNKVWFSSRLLSRITRIDWATATGDFHQGHMFNNGTGLAQFGHNLHSFQHAPEPQPNGNVLLFDNGNLIEPLSAPRQSRAIEITYDNPVNPTTASIAWEYRGFTAQGAPIFSPFVGDADRLPNGNTLVDFGASGELHEVDPAGNLVWRMVTPAFPTNLIYRAQRVDKLLHDTPSDTDGDWDIDLHDLARLQVSYRPMAPGALVFPDTLSDADGDGDLDFDDVESFNFWFTGPGRHEDPQPQ